MEGHEHQRREACVGVQAGVTGEAWRDGCQAPWPWAVGRGRAVRRAPWRGVAWVHDALLAPAELALAPQPSFISLVLGAPGPRPLCGWREKRPRPVALTYGGTT